MEEELVQLEIGDNIESDHHPLIVGMKKRGNRRNIRSRKERVWRGVWDEEGRERFKLELECVGIPGREVHEEIGELNGRIKKIRKDRD